MYSALDAGHLPVGIGLIYFSHMKLLNTLNRQILPIVWLMGLCCSFGKLNGSSFLKIAHRGGFVTDSLPENSFTALEEAIRRGYTHVEIDVRITKDSHVVCFHHDELMEQTGITGRISEMNLAQVQKVKLLHTGEHIPTLEEFCNKCAGRIDLMIDLKGCANDQMDAYASEIESTLKKHHLLKNSLILINKTPINNQEKIAKRFLHKAKISWRKSLEQTRAEQLVIPNLASDYYVFNHGADFDDQEVKGFQKLGLSVIVSINTGHYKSGDPVSLGLNDIKSMLAYGVDGIQLDACYESGLTFISPNANE